MKKGGLHYWFPLVIPLLGFLRSRTYVVMNESAVAKKVSSAYARAKRSDDASTERMRRYALEFLHIVKSEVLRFKARVPRHIEIEELHGVAICGLMKAFPKFEDHQSDENIGIYIRQRVRGAILDELRRLDTMTRGARRKARLYDQAQKSVEQREGRLASEQEIRAELGLEPQEFDAFLEELRPITFFSIDEAANSEKGVDIAGRLEDPTDVRVSERMESMELMDSLRDRIEELPDVQRKVLHMYYFKDFRLAEIAEVFKVSESRVCQLHTQAIRSLRAQLNRQMLKETT